jgi:hypothetical protein
MRHETTDSAAHTFTCMLAFLGAILVSKLLQRRCRLISGSRLSLERVFVDFIEPGQRNLMGHFAKRQLCMNTGEI